MITHPVYTALLESCTENDTYFSAVVLWVTTKGLLYGCSASHLWKHNLAVLCTEITFIGVSHSELDSNTAVSFLLIFGRWVCTSTMLATWREKPFGIGTICRLDLSVLVLSLVHLLQIRQLNGSVATRRQLLASTKIIHSLVIKPLQTLFWF